jgi:hypothetical protein
VGLGRSDSAAAGLVPMQTVAPATTGALWNNEEGNVVSVRTGVRTRSGRRPTSASTLEDTSFTRSRDPCTSIPTRLAVRKHLEVGRALRYRGRANLRKREEPAPGSERTDECAARRVSPLCRQLQRSCVMRKKRKVVMATVPARKREPRAQRPYVVCSCRSRQAASWPRISSYAALQKEWRSE